MKGWKKVVFVSDCIFQEWDDDHECPICPQCGGEYSDCHCPGPTMDDHQYKEKNGVLYAKKINHGKTDDSILR